MKNSSVHLTGTVHATLHMETQERLATINRNGCSQCSDAQAVMPYILSRISHVLCPTRELYEFFRMFPNVAVNDARVTVQHLHRIFYSG